MRAFSIIICILVGLLTACVQPSQVMETQSSEKPPAPSKEEREKIEQQIKKYLLGIDWNQNYNRVNRHFKLVEVKQHLFWSESIGEKIDFVKLRSDLHRLGDQKEFVDLLNEAIIWKADVESFDADYIYSQYQILAQEARLIPREVIFASFRWGDYYEDVARLAHDLLRLAGKKGHDEAKMTYTRLERYRLAARQFDYNKKKKPLPLANRQTAMREISQYADQNFLPAQFDLFDRFRQGRYIRKDHAAAYYWGSRALKNGYKNKLAVDALKTQLSQAELKRVADWEIKGLVPQPYFIRNPIILYPPLPSAQPNPAISPAERRKIERNYSLRLINTQKDYREGRVGLDEIRSHLRFLAFRLEPKDIKRNIEVLERLGGQQDFIELFNEILNQKNEWEKLDAESQYQMVLKLRHDLSTIPREFTSLVTGWDSRMLHDEYIARKLLALAAEKGHKKAKVLDYLSRERRYATMDIQMKTRGLAHIEDLKQEALNQTSEIADRDYLPAQFDLFHRLSNGWQVKQDYAAAYYWGKRALKNGAKLRPELNALAKRLTLPNKNQIIKWENTITLPKLLLKK